MSSSSMNNSTVRTCSMAQAVREALDEEMARDSSVFILGEDIGKHGGALGVTAGLYKKYPDRVLDTPICECGFTGLALGAAYAGMKPVVELMFADFIGVIFDYLMNQATRNRYMTGMQEGGRDCCFVLRAPNGAGVRGGAQHSQTVEQYLLPIPGLTVVAPSFPGDAKGLMKTALRGNDPVVFLENKLLFYKPMEIEDSSDLLVPIGKAKVIREGKDVTVVGTQFMLHKALDAAEKLSKNRIDAEVIDLRTVKPLDTETILASVRKTGRLVLTNEGPTTGNIKAEIVCRVAEQAYNVLKAAPVRVCCPDTPIPFAPNLEDTWLIQSDDIARGILKAMGK